MPAWPARRAGAPPRRCGCGCAAGALLCWGDEQRVQAKLAQRLDDACGHGLRAFGEGLVQHDGAKHRAARLLCVPQFGRCIFLLGHVLWPCVDERWFPLGAARVGDRNPPTVALGP